MPPLPANCMYGLVVDNCMAARVSHGQHRPSPSIPFDITKIGLKLRWTRLFCNSVQQTNARRPLYLYCTVRASGRPNGAGVAGPQVAHIRGALLSRFRSLLLAQGCSGAPVPRHSKLARARLCETSALYMDMHGKKGSSGRCSASRPLGGSTSPQCGK